MDGSVANFSEHDTDGVNEDIYNGDQENPYSEEGHEYNEATVNTYNPEVANIYNGESVYNEGVVDMYKEGEVPYSYNDETGEPINDKGEKIAGEEQGNPHDEKEQDMNIQPTVSEKRWPGWPGDNVFRMLVPSHKVGAIIGHKGEFIKKLCEESKARIKFLEGHPGMPERAVIVSAKEELDMLISPAMDGLLKIHLRAVDGLDGDADHPPAVVTTKLLVPAVQAGSFIGKHGATIKSIQEGSGAIVRVLDNLPPFALPDDRLVEIQGDPACVHKAVELIASHLRKFLVDHSVLPLFETYMLMHSSHREQPMPSSQPWGPPHGSLSGGPGFGGSSQFMPSGHHGNYYPPPDLPPVEKPPHYGMPAYGREPSSMGVHSSAMQQSSYGTAKVTHHMQIPLSYTDAVIGAQGASISYIRRASGATVIVQETRGVPGEMTVEIIGSASQVQAAVQLIQNFMAEAAAPSQASVASHHTIGAVDLNSYSGYGQPAYGNVPPASGPPAPTGGGGAYGSYTTNYGY